MTSYIRYTILLLMLNFGIQAQNMFVRTNSSGQTSFPITNISKLIFSNGNISIQNNKGTSNSFELASLRYLNFTDLTLSTPNVESYTEKVLAYPNPVNEYLNLSIPSFFTNVSSINIFTIEGRLLMKADLTDNDLNKIDVSLLPKGMYLCTIQNNSYNQIIKFVKQ